MANARLLDVEAAVAVTQEELTEVLRAWPNFGCFSIFMTHPVHAPKDIAVKIFPLCLIAAQLLIPMALTYSFFMRFMQSDDRTQLTSLFCPQIALTQERVLAIAIALIYSVRSSMAFRGKSIELDPSTPLDSLPPAKAAELRLRERSGVLHSPLNDYGQVDEFMSVSYEGLVYLLNLWLTLHSPDGSTGGDLNRTSDTLIDVIAASLALQFAIELPEEFKERYFDYYGQAVARVWSEKLHAQHSSLMLSCHEVDGQGRLRDVPWAQLRFGSCSKGMRFCLFLLWYVPEIAIAKVLSWAVPIICRVCIVYLPVCI